MKAFLSFCSLNNRCKAFFVPHKTQEVSKKEKQEKTREDEARQRKKEINLNAEDQRKREKGKRGGKI